MEGAECLSVGRTSSSNCIGWSDLSQKAAAYASERLMTRAAQEMEAKMRVKMDSLQKQLEERRTKYGLLEKSHEELKTLHQACKADLEHSVVNQKKHYEDIINSLKRQVEQLEEAALCAAASEKLSHEQNTAAETLRMENIALRAELEKLVQIQNEKQAQSSKEKARLREEAGRQQARALELEAKNEQLTRRLDKLNVEMSEVTLEREHFERRMNAEVEKMNHEAQAATIEAQDTAKKTSETVKSLTRQLQQMQAEYTSTIRRLQDSLTRQTQQLRDAEENLRQQKRETEKRLSKLIQDTNDQIAKLDAEKRRALEDAAQAMQNSKDDEYTRNAECQKLQQQCQRLAYQHASAQAKCEELLKRAEDVHTDCERRVGEFSRLQADFRTLEDSHRNLLAEMEAVTAAKEQAAAELLSSRTQLSVCQSREAELKKANQELLAKASQAKTANEQLRRRFHHTICEGQRINQSLRRQVESARKTENDFNATTAMLRNRVSEVTAERNGLWHVVLQLKNGPLQERNLTFQPSRQPYSVQSTSGAVPSTTESNSQQGYPPGNSLSASFNAQLSHSDNRVSSTTPSATGLVFPVHLPNEQFTTKQSNVNEGHTLHIEHARGGTQATHSGNAPLQDRVTYNVTGPLPQQELQYTDTSQIEGSKSKYAEGFVKPVPSRQETAVEANSRTYCESLIPYEDEFEDGLLALAYSTVQEEPRCLHNPFNTDDSDSAAPACLPTLCNPLSEVYT